jgi:hypothetical protein
MMLKAIFNQTVRMLIPNTNKITIIITITIYHKDHLLTNNLNQKEYKKTLGFRLFNTWIKLSKKSTIH